MISFCLCALLIKSKKPVVAGVLLHKQVQSRIHTVLYLILVQGVWLECFIRVRSRDILVDERRGVTSVVGGGAAAEQLIIKDFPIWLSWRGPGDQKCGV